MEDVDTIVIGAGVVGLACARSLALAGRDVLLLEAESAIGSATSARNSEVIHAGLYNPPGWLKARLCVQGKAMLYRYLEERAVAHRRCGKLIVATSRAQEPELLAIRERALACGVPDLELISAAQARAMEPALECTAALWSPSTGIVDSHGLMLALQGEAESKGAWLALRSPVLGVTVGKAGLEVDVGGDEPMRLRARALVNCAGLHAQALAARIEGLAKASIAPSHWARGHYFSLSGRAAFTHLIYPLPEPGGLGVHVTLDLGGQMRFGPDVQWVPTTALGDEDYAVDPALADAFAASIRRYWPGLGDQTLLPAYAGLRPKVVGPGAPAADFLIQGPETHGIAGLVNLFGIESPGLTACLAIGDHVAELLAHTPR